MIEKINRLKAEIESLTAKDLAEVDQLRIKYLSKKAKFRSCSMISAPFRPIKKRDGSGAQRT